ncbi:MAG: hypothetical protein HRU38_08940 [Saccharospirillaceae bacterium]|nr:hypothetical protein [Pseudomonadales bacterium]NRB78780.1 hypothetical protein [Saccharospirillaceae bacterium]
MRNLSRALLSISIVVLSPLSIGQSLVLQAKALIDNNQYLKAEVFILSVDTNNSEYKNLQKVLSSIEPAKEQFVKDSISETNLYYLNRNTDYGQAIFVITQALKVLPNNEDLLATFESIDILRKDEGQKLRQEILVKQGKYLLDVVTLEKSYKVLYPDDQSVVAKYERFQLEKQQVANELAIQAKYLFNESFQLAVANDIAMLAFQLDPNDKIELIYNQINQRIQTRTADIRELESKHQQKLNEVEINYWSDQFSVDLSKGNITESNQAVKELESFGVDTFEFKIRINRKIELMLQRALIRGNTLWSEGRIEEALAKWLEVQQYGRNNRILNTNISNAQSFIAYYNEVKQQNQ